jgi:MOSC domain-containing protein YiiM
MGENITTTGIDLLTLPKGTELQIGQKVLIEITGLRNPCKQLDNFQKGLTLAVLERDDSGNIIRKAGIMGIVLVGWKIVIGDCINITLPPKPHYPLECV